MKKAKVSGVKQNCQRKFGCSHTYLITRTCIDWLTFHSDNRGLANFTIEMEYADGDGEWFVVDRRENYNNAGRFFVELSDEITSELTQVKLLSLGFWGQDQCCHKNRHCCGGMFGRG